MPRVIAASPRTVALQKQGDARRRAVTGILHSPCHLVCVICWIDIQGKRSPFPLVQHSNCPGSFREQAVGGTLLPRTWGVRLVTRMLVLCLFDMRNVASRWVKCTGACRFLRRSFLPARRLPGHIVRYPLNKASSFPASPRTAFIPHNRRTQLSAEAAARQLNRSRPKTQTPTGHGKMSEDSPTRVSRPRPRPTPFGGTKLAKATASFLTRNNNFLPTAAP